MMSFFKPQLIEILSTDLVTKTGQYESVYSLVNNGHFKPLQRILFWVLGKLKAHATWYREERVVKEVIDVNNFEKLFGRQFGQLMQVGYSPDFIVCGPEEYCAIVSNPQNINAYCDPRDLRMNNLPLVMVPWIKGFFLMPRLDKGNQLERMEFRAPEGVAPEKLLLPPYVQPGR